MSNVVEFPGTTLPTEGYSEAQIDKLHSGAFRDLEGKVCDLDRMGEITESLVMECSLDPESYRKLELAGFAVQQLAKMLRVFKTDYHKRWHGELVGPS